MWRIYLLYDMHDTMTRPSSSTACNTDRQGVKDKATCTSTCTCFLIELYLYVTGENDVEVARLVQGVHLAPAQPESVSVEVSANVHQLLFSVCVQFRMKTCEPPKLKQI